MSVARDAKKGEAIFYEQTKLLFHAITTSIWGTTLGIVFMLFILWPVTDHAILVGWGLLFTLITALRACHAYYFHTHMPGPTQARKWVRQFAAGSFIAAFTWSSTVLWIFPEDDLLRQAIIAFMFAVTASVAMTSLSVVRYISITYIIIVMLPISLRIIMEDGDTTLILGMMLLITIVLFSAAANRLHHSTVNNIALRLDALGHEKELQDSQQRLALHMQNTPLAVIEWNNRFQVTEWNTAAQKIFGYAREEMLGKGCLDQLVPDYAHDQVNWVHDDLLNQEGGFYSLNENVTKDGRTILCEWFNTPLIDNSGDVIGIASLCQDVTQRVRLEQMKNEFISVVSHELRTPLTSILGSLGLLLGGTAGAITGESRNLLQIANQNSQRLLNIVNDILDIERIETGQLEYNLQTIPVMPLIERTIENNNSYAMKYDVRLAIGQGLEQGYLSADENRIMQVLDNLVSNAIKFSPKGQEVQISATRHGDMIRIAVSDHGPGIPKDFHSQLFSKFSQLDASNTRGVGGTGLGLSIAKGIVEHHHGRIGFSTHVGKGTTFYFELPELTE